MATLSRQRLDTGELPTVQSADRRDSYRFDVNGAARLQLPAIRLPVADLSASGMAFLMPRQHLRSLNTGRAQFQLGAESSFEARFDTVSTASAGTDSFRVGTRFRHLDRSALQKLSEFLIRKLMTHSRLAAIRRSTTESALVSEDGAFLAALLRFHGVALRRPVRAYLGERSLANRLAITEVREGERIQIASLMPLPRAFHPGAQLSFLLSTGGSALWFSAVVRYAEPHRAELSFPVRVVRSGFRDSFRAPVDPADVEVRFGHPRLPVTLSKRALDVSARGLSFPLDLDQDILFPGDHLDPLHIQLPDGALRATAIVRSVRQLTAGGMACGVELTELSDPYRWATSVFHSGHPNSLLSEETAPAGSWRALDTSGYVSLWTHPKALDTAKREFEQEWQTMPRKHGHLLVVKRDRQAVGTIAANRVYRQTWMMHLLGVDKAARKIDDRAGFYKIVRELYSGLTFMLAHLTDLKYLVGYFATDSRWNDALHVAFEREYPFPEHLATSQYTIYRTSEEAPHRPADTSQAQFRVRQLVAQDLDDVAVTLAQRFTEQECDAYDFGAEYLLDDKFGRECAAAGYDRSRTNFVIRDGAGQRVGLLMMETGAERINLFNLLNICRFVPLPVLGSDAGLVRGVGLAFAKQYYERAGKHSHLFFDYSKPQAGDGEYPGYQHLCDGLAWMIHREALTPWLNFIDDLLGIKSDPTVQSEKMKQKS